VNRRESEATALLGSMRAVEAGVADEATDRRRQVRDRRGRSQGRVLGAGQRTILQVGCDFPPPPERLIPID